MNDDIWQEGARTDRAIELLRLCAAKTDASGEVIPTYRYSRSFKHVADHLRHFSWGARSETVNIEESRDAEKHTASVTVSITVVTADGGGWEQEGVATLGEDSYDWHALAACRALLHFVHDDGEPMTPDQVIAMLEEQRSKAMAAAKRESA